MKLTEGAKSHMDDQLETTPQAARAVPASGEAEIAGLEEREKPGKALERELKMSREDVRTLLRENAVLRREKAALLNQWYEAERSLGWKLVQSGAKYPGQAVPREYTPGAMLDPVLPIHQDRPPVRHSPGRPCNAHQDRPNSRRAHPTEIRLDTGLPGSPGKFQAPGRSVPGFALAVVGRGSAQPIGETRLLQAAPGLAFRRSHRAPLCLLRLAEELSKLADVEFWIVLTHGGELADAFARIAPTLELETLIGRGVHSQQVPGLIAASFHEFSSRGVAICNTLAVSEFHAAFAARNVSVLSWVHELPTFIESVGGKEAIEQIKAASRKIMVPADAVRSALASRFGVDPDRIRTVYNGQDARTRDQPRENIRRRVLQELTLPDDARIVLGCGTVDLRKGADLFVNVARRVLTDPLATSLSGQTYFVWVGHCSDLDFERWLRHDAAIGELEHQIQFIGPRAETAPYFMAADLFLLTSREDPCPLVNLEAMEAGLPVVAFEGAGSARRCSAMVASAFRTSTSTPWHAPCASSWPTPASERTWASAAKS